jgi:hypothetical protein
MTHHYFGRTIVFGCMLLVFAGFARADIVKCVDETETVAYMDVPCENGADSVRASALTNPSTISARVSSRANSIAATAEIRKAAWVTKRAGNRSLSSDVATLKSARSSMLLMDQESSLLRQKKFAALDQKGRHWFDFW